MNFSHKNVPLLLQNSWKWWLENNSSMFNSNNWRQSKDNKQKKRSIKYVTEEAQYRSSNTNAFAEARHTKTWPVLILLVANGVAGSQQIRPRGSTFLPLAAAYSSILYATELNRSKKKHSHKCIHLYLYIYSLYQAVSNHAVLAKILFHGQYLLLLIKVCKNLSTVFSMHQSCNLSWLLFL